MANGRIVTIEIEEYRELMMLKGTMVSLENYIKQTEHIYKDVILFILGIEKKEDKNE